MMDLYLHMVTALVLVTGLIFLLGKFFKKRQEKEGLMKIMGYQSLGAKKGIAMIRVGPEVLLVGVTATDVKLLKAMDPVVENVDETANVRRLRPAAAVVEKDGETESRRRPEQAGGVITADASDKLGRLKAMKDSLRDALYAAH